MPSNSEFLSALFGGDAQWAHVTDFTYDPGNIPEGRHLTAWKGDYFSRYRFTEGSNQYFTISTFFADEKGTARRRKALYRATHVIVLDDVREKLNIEQVSKLPEPTWILETSAGSEQWGYLLPHPVTERHRVENLLDGLVANGLAPEGRDPGMKGVTRYVRLPDGANSKASRLVNGQPFKCRLLKWSPFTTATMEELAAPFFVDLDAVRRESRVDGAAAVDDHPLLSVPDLIHIKEERSDGRFDVTCPWVDEHTGREDNGAAIFTNADGTIGFKCHHGSCQDRTGRHLLQVIEEDAPGFSAKLKGWQLMRSFSQVAPAAPSITFMDSAPTHAVVPSPPVTIDNPLSHYYSLLRTHQPYSPEAKLLAGQLLRAVDDLPAIERVQWHNDIRDTMKWTKPELKDILQSLREEWYVKSTAKVNFFDEVVFVRELNQFYDRAKRIFYNAEAYQNAYADLDPEARKSALQGGLVTKVDKLDYAPKQPPVFIENATVYANSWSDSGVAGHPGNIDWYFEHYDHLGWSQNRKHIMQYMAYTIRNPDSKINHMLLFGSGEGCGKDWLLFPLVLAMGENHTTIEGDELLSDFHDYALSTKHLHVNEAELGDRREALTVTNKVKRLAAAPPDHLRINQKGIKPIKIRNVLSITMTTNSQTPLRLNGVSRRIYAVWSDLQVRDSKDEMLPEWLEYWRQRWEWMRNGGAEAVIYHLRHNVDLKDFDPGRAPPMTEFLRDIREASKSPLQQTIEAFINNKIGSFSCDLITAADLTETLKAGVVLHNHLIYCDVQSLTPNRVGCILRDIAGTRKLRARVGLEEVNLWAIRDALKYTQMSQGDMYREYRRQIEIMKTTTPMSVVKAAR